MKRYQLSNGATYCTMPDGSKQCTGSMMGRRNVIPPDIETLGKVQLQRLRWVDGDYDSGGAYWGNSGGTSIYVAFGQTATEHAECFVRAATRAEAKRLVREVFGEHVTFYR